MKSGSAYYHQDCYTEKQNKNDIFKMTTEYMSTSPPASRIWRAINTLVHNKDVDSGLLKFALSKYISSKKPLRYPEGLYYVVTEEIMKEYNRLNCPKYQFEVVSDVGCIFQYNPPKEKRFEDLL